MSAIVTKVTNVTNSLVAKSTQLANAAVYWGKVTAEVGKIVYKAEGLAPPSQKQFQQVYQTAWKSITSPQQQKELLAKVTQFQPTKDNLAKGAVYGVHLLAFFSVGEIIGRRSVFGYPSVHSEHH